MSPDTDIDIISATFSGLVTMPAMVARKPYLSKSRIISAWQCPKKLHLEKHHPELGETSAHTES